MFCIKKGYFGFLQNIKLAMGFPSMMTESYNKLKKEAKSKRNYSQTCFRGLSDLHSHALH